MSSLRNNEVIFSPAGLSGRVYSVEEVDDAAYQTFSQGKLRVHSDVAEDDHTVPVVINTRMESSLINAEAPVKHTWTRYLLFCSLSAIMGSTFLFGYNAVVINEPANIFKAFINSSYSERYLNNHGNGTEWADAGLVNNLWTWTVSLFLVGGTVGALIGGAEADRFGRKNALLINTVIGVIAGGLMFAAPYVNIFELMMVGRFVAGIHCGSVSAIVPGYLTELAPLTLRGAAGTINQASIVCGGFSAAVLGLPVILSRADEPDVWPFLFFPCVVLPAVQFLLLFFSVESPIWLIMKRRDEGQAFISLSKLREKHLSREFIENEVLILRREREVQEGLPTLGFFQSLVGSLGWPLVICLMMQFAQQLSGINAAIYYSSTIFGQILENPIPQYASLGVVGTTVVMTFVSTFIIERVGRRILMISGIFGMWVSCIFITIFMTLDYITPAFNYLTIVFTFIFVAAFAIGPGPIPWFIAPELSSPQFRPIVIALCTFANWSANLATGLGYPPIEEALQSYSFLPFFGLLSFFLVFSILFLPETRGLSAEENIHRLSLRKIQLNFGRWKHQAFDSRTQSAVSTFSGL